MVASFKKNFLIPMLVLLMPVLLKAQASSELELLLGFSSYSGDLAPGPFAFRQVNPAGGLKYRIFFDRKISFSAGANYGRISGDRLDIPTFVNKEGTVEMEAGILEVSANVEYYLRGGPRYNNAGLFIERWSPFIGLGLGLAFADAEVKTGPEYTGGRFPENDDRSTFLVIPMTGGLRLDYNEHWTVSFSIGARAVFSDYLDGVSQNGNPDFNDWYWFGGVSLIYFLKGERSTHSESRR